MAAEAAGNRRYLKLDFSLMGLEHLDQVSAIEALSFSQPWSREAFFYEVTKNDFALYVVALYKNQVAGYSGLWLVLDEGHLTNVAVHPKLRGKGTGRALMTEIISRAASLGVERLTLEVRASNSQALGLYSSLGFVEKGVRKKYYSDNNEDALIMWLDLKGLGGD
jgi:ribosomal-protein-alanine N-acetyltransferase